MQRITSLVFLVSLLIMFTSVVNQCRADPCSDSQGVCDNCDQKCKAKHGPSATSQCAGPGGGLCECMFQCTVVPPKTCAGGHGLLCSQSCDDKCCDKDCAQKYPGGHGACDTLGDYNLCQCQYPC